VSNLDNDKVRRVRQALRTAGVDDTVVEVPDTVHSAAEACQMLGIEPGALARTFVYTVGNRYVLAVIAGDHVCRDDQLARVFNFDGAVVRPPAELVRAVTGFSPTGLGGGVAPLGLVAKLPVALDASLKRFERIYLSAGHSHCVFSTTLQELKGLTDGTLSYALASPKVPSQKTIAPQ